MGPNRFNAHEADDFRPTRELADDFKIPGGYSHSDDHWRVYNKRVEDERRAYETGIRRRGLKRKGEEEEAWIGKEGRGLDRRL